VFQCLATLRNVLRISNRLVKVKLSLYTRRYDDGQPQDLATFPRKKHPPVPTGQGAGWTQLHYTIFRSEKFLASVGKRIPIQRLSNLQPRDYTDNNPGWQTDLYYTFWLCATITFIHYKWTQGQWSTEKHKEPVRKIRAAFEFNFPLLFILSTPQRGAGLTINYPVPNPEHATLQSSTSEHEWNLTKTEREPGIRGSWCFRNKTKFGRGGELKMRKTYQIIIPLNIMWFGMCLNHSYRVALNNIRPKR